MALLQRCRVLNWCSLRQQPASNRQPSPCLPCFTKSGFATRSGVIVTAIPKVVWLQTSDKATFTVALESGGVSAFVFGPDPEQLALASAWAALGRFISLYVDGRGVLTEGATGRMVGEVVVVDSPEAARALEARVQGQRLSRSLRQGEGADATANEEAADRSKGQEWTLVLDAKDWKVIPAENLVALAQPRPPTLGPHKPGSPSLLDGAPPTTVRLLAAAFSSEGGRLMLEALEAGTGGVLLRTNDPAEVRTLVSYVSQRVAEESGRSDAKLQYTVAKVVGVRQLGLGDRACVDMAGLMQPGEGLLVGSFARCLALVHSECGESQYIASRPFRVNAGPVHAYVSCPGGRTRYLSELSSGTEVLVADPAGRSRTALVGRVKIERRPLVLVELETRIADGDRDTAGDCGSQEEVGGAEEVVRHSLMLQNAETVKLVGPPRGWRKGQSGQGQLTQGRAGGARADACGRDVGSDEVAWCAISVSELEPGDLVSVVLQPPARHTGIAVDEFILEK